MLTPTYHPVYRSLNKPLTIWGAERRLFFLAAIMGAATFNFFASLGGALLMFGGLFLAARWATATDPDTIIALQEELADRFGRLPPPARALVDTHRLRLDAQALGVRRIDAAPGTMWLHFVPQPPVDVARIMQLIGRDRRVRLAGQDKLRIDGAPAELEARLQQLRTVFKALAGA